MRDRRDANERGIIDAFEGLQCLVWQLCEEEPSDLLILIKGATHDRLRLVEIKDPSKPPSKRRLTPTQKRTHSVWPIHVIQTVDQVVDLVAFARGRLRRATLVNGST